VTNRTLLTVSGTIASDLADSIGVGNRPRADFFEMAQTMRADVVDYAGALDSAGRFGRLLRRLGGDNALLAWTCFRRRRRYDAIVTDGEQIGIPYAALTLFSSRRRRPRHAMIVHIMSVPKKALIFRTLQLRCRVDAMFVYSSWQRQYAVNSLGMKSAAVVLTSFMVDAKFFAIDQVVAAPRRMICAAGLEFRDYDTLIAAVIGLDVDLVIAAASPWSKRPNELEAAPLPENVTVCKLTLFELRQLYADAMFVVMPLREVEFQAGVTTILEAMSMSKPVVCSRTRGQTDVIIDGATGMYVPPGDAGALRRAITSLLDDADMTSRLGTAAREWVVHNADIENYAARFARSVEGLTTDSAS
jgi:glycosyltransferase involved in cell wall biosynthesis